MSKGYSCCLWQARERGDSGIAVRDVNWCCYRDALTVFINKTQTQIEHAVVKRTTRLQPPTTLQQLR